METVNPNTLTVNPFVLIGGSFSLVSALAWNNLIQSAITEYYPISKGEERNLQAKLVYAIVITVVAITVMLLLNIANKDVARVASDVQTYARNRALSAQYKTA